MVNFVVYFNLIYLILKCFFYFKADSVADHKLKWEMFRFQELEGFDAMLNRLYKQELGTIVGKYEKYR